MSIAWVELPVTVEPTAGGLDFHWQVQSPIEEGHDFCASGLDLLEGQENEAMFGIPDKVGLGQFYPKISEVQLLMYTGTK